MSHFIILVLGDGVDEQLAPYDENLDTEPYLASLEGEWKTELDKAREYYATKTDLDVSDWTSQRFLDNWHSPGSWRPSADGGFERWSSYNPKSKWDWYVTGGRWEGYLPLRDGSVADEAKLKDIDLDKLQTPFAFVKDGQWFQSGEMGWFGMSIENKKDDVWEAEFKQGIRDLDPETLVTAVDCHI